MYINDTPTTAYTETDSQKITLDNPALAGQIIRIDLRFFIPGLDLPDTMPIDTGEIKVINTGTSFDLLSTGVNTNSRVYGNIEIEERINIGCLAVEIDSNELSKQDSLLYFSSQGVAFSPEIVENERGVHVATSQAYIPVYGILKDNSNTEENTAVEFATLEQGQEVFFQKIPNGGGNFSLPIGKLTTLPPDPKPNIESTSNWEWVVRMKDNEFSRNQGDKNVNVERNARLTTGIPIRITYESDGKIRNLREWCSKS